MNKVKVQSYNIPLQIDRFSKEYVVGSFVYTNIAGDEIVGFISKALPDQCAEITLFLPMECPEYDGMDEIKDTITDDELRIRMEYASSQNPIFNSFMEQLKNEISGSND